MAYKGLSQYAEKNELRKNRKVVKYCESKAFRKENLRKVQDHQASWPRNGHLRESEAQAETGIIFKKGEISNGTYIRC